MNLAVDRALLQEPIITGAPVARDVCPTGSKVLFLDRDGVINVNHGYVHAPEQTDWVPGIFDLARAAVADGWLIVVVTNQAGIARGYYSLEQFVDYTHWLHGQFERQGAPIAATYYCPHHPEVGASPWRTTCPCRKPAPGMLLAAIDRFSVDVQASLLVGDSLSDLQAASAAGVRSHLLKPAQWGPRILDILTAGCLTVTTGG